jgi:hypothetical protein
VSKIHYEGANSTDLPPAEARVVYAGMKNGAPRFNMFIERDKMDDPLDCKIVQAAVCEVLGVRLAFSPAAELKGAITLSFERAAAERSFGVYDPNKHLQ